MSDFKVGDVVFYYDINSRKIEPWEIFGFIEAGTEFVGVNIFTGEQSGGTMTVKKRTLQIKPAIENTDPLPPNTFRMPRFNQPYEDEVYRTEKECMLGELINTELVKNNKEIFESLMR